MHVGQPRCPIPNELDFEISSEFGERTADSATRPSMDLTATLADDGLRERVDSATADLERTSFDSSLLDFDFEVDERPSPKTAAPSFATSTNLNAIDLELSKTIDTALEMPDAGPPTEPPLDMELQQEVATKLELARAYEEMGDKEGAGNWSRKSREGAGRQLDEGRSILARLS